MPTVKIDNEFPEALCRLRRFNDDGTVKETLCFVNDGYPEEKKNGEWKYASQHKLTDKEVEGLRIKPGVLVIVDEPKKGKK